MKTRLLSFNIYLCLAALLLAVGCSTEARQRKELSTIRVFLEAEDDGTGMAGDVEVTKARYKVTINKESLLDESDVDAAELVDGLGGPEMQVVFNDHGTLLLNMVSVANKGRRLVIMTQSPDTRWLACPVMRSIITTGTLRFTPDPSCTRTELERIVSGLNKVAKKNKNLNAF